MSSFPSDKSERQRSHVLGWGLTLLLALAAAGVVAYLSLYESRRAQTANGEIILQQLAAHLAIDRALLIPLSTLHPTANSYTADELQAAARSIRHNYPYISAFFYLQRAPQQNGSAAHDTLIATYISSDDPRTKKYLYTDLYQTPGIAGALKQALSGGGLGTALLGRFGEHAPAYITLMPVYAGGPPGNAPARRARYVGAFMFVIDLANLFNGILASHPGWSATVAQANPLSAAAATSQSSPGMAQAADSFGPLVLQRDLSVDHYRLRVTLSHPFVIDPADFLLVLIAFAIPLALYAVVVRTSNRRPEPRPRTEPPAEGRIIEDERRRAYHALRSLADGVVTTDAESRIRYMNPAASRLCGWPLEEVLGQPISRRLPLSERHTGRPLPGSAGELLDGPLDGKLRDRQGEEIPVEISLTPLSNSDSGGLAIVLRDMRRERELAQALAFHADHDQISGLHNRQSFERRLQQWFERQERKTARGMLCQIDINQFSLINDTAGYRAGDELLRRIGALLEQELPQDALIARLGGDEFGLLLPGADAAALQHLRDLLHDYEFHWEEHRFHVGASIGAVALGIGPDDTHALLTAADTACLIAREKGRNQLHVYMPDDAAVARRARELNWPEQLHAAIRENRIELFQQLMLPLKANAQPPMIYEFLMHLRLGNGERISPTEFVPAAERYHLMRDIDRYVIDCAFAQIAASGIPETLYTINLSGQSLDDPELGVYILERLRDHAIGARQICFEITETAAIANLHGAQHLISELRKRDFRFALDDFGAGLSSFAYLKRLPVDFLKIEGEFVRGLLHNETDRVLVDSIVNIAKAFGLMIIAESVENAQTLDRLREIGVDYAQGYHLGRPRPATHQAATA